MADRRLRSRNIVRIVRALVRQSEFGDAWPLTVASGTLSCVCYRTRAVIFIDVGGVRYALNFIAMRPRTMLKRKLNNLLPIWRDDPTLPGAKINLAPLFARANALLRTA